MKSFNLPRGNCYSATILLALIALLLIIIRQNQKDANFENVVFEDVNIRSLQNRIHPWSEMSDLEQRFLYGLLTHYKPSKIVEIGVRKGGSSAIILDAIHHRPQAHLYSIDKSIHVDYVAGKGKLVGFLVNETFPDYLNQWTLYTGGITTDFIEQIGGNIDCVLIDTFHFAPGEMIDFLEVLPYLKEKALVIIHDIALQLSTFATIDRSHPRRENLQFSCNLLYYYLRGKKLLPQPTATKLFWNIGAVQLDAHQNNYYYDYFFPLANHWEYMPQRDDLEKLRVFFYKHYGQKYLRMFEEAIKENEIFLSTYSQNPTAIEWNSGFGN